MKKNLMKLIIATVALAAFCLSSAAQTSTDTKEFPAGFTGIEVSDDFEISLKTGETCSVTWSVDAVLKDYIEVYVKGQVLHIEFNRKGMSSELKKTYRGKNAPKPTLNASITVAELRSLTVTDNVVVNAYNEDFYGDSFSLTASGASKINNLGVASGSAKISLSKNAQAKVTVYTNKDLTVSTGNSSVLNLEQESNTLSVSASGSSNVTIAGNVIKGCDVSNSSVVTLNGSCPSLSVKSQSGSAVTDATAFQVKEANITMSGSGQVSVSPTDILKLDIKDGTVNFSNDPKVEIVSIVKASVIRK